LVRFRSSTDATRLSPYLLAVIARLDRAIQQPLRIRSAQSALRLHSGGYWIARSSRAMTVKGVGNE
jgi:hypothetical protein